MANENEIKPICECQYILSVSNDRKNACETKNKFNNVPNIHEIDEDSEPEETTLEQLHLSDKGNSMLNKGDQEIKDASEDECAYITESFCSDESCDESEITNVTPNSLISDSSSLPYMTKTQPNKSTKMQNAESNVSKCKNNLEDSYSLDGESFHAATPDRLLQSKRYKRWNMTFTDEEMRKIERENELLLRKIMAQQKSRPKILEECATQSKISSSAINRKKLQKKIENENMLLLRRIQQAKSCVFANASKVGCRLTFL